jgi:SHS2 domain-containing protein
MTIEELTHTADVRIRVTAPTVAALFEEAARGMMEVMYGGCDQGLVTEEVTLDADDPEELLHDFLSELLYLSDVRGMVYCAARVRIDQRHLSAILEGIPFDRERHQGTEIKGISYYGLQIVKEGESYATDILFDV